MSASGMERIVYSVGSMEKALAFYRDYIGLEVVAEGVVERAEVTQLYGLPATTGAKAVFLKNELQDTLVELIEFRPNSGRVIRKGPHDWDYGIYDIAFFVRDIQACYRDAVGKGWKFILPPSHYKPNWVPWEVKETVLIGPDNAPFVLFERVTAEAQAYDRPYIRFNHSAQIIPSQEEVKRFYGGVLGLDVRSEVELPAGVVDTVMGVPRETKVRASFYEKKGSNTALMEFLEMDSHVPSKSLADVAKPPNLGMFMIAFPVDSLVEVKKALEREKFAVLVPPVEVTDPVRGRARALIARGPGDVWVELFEK